MQMLLRKLDRNKDIPVLYEYMCGDDQHLFSGNYQSNDEADFSRWLEGKLGKSFHDFRMVGTTDGETLGYVHDFDFSLQDGHCKISTYIREKDRESGAGAIATIQFLDHLFKEYPLRKVYTTVFDYNHVSLQANAQAGFKEEGSLLEYRYYDGHYWDLHYFSITREDFYSTYSRILSHAEKEQNR